MTINNIIKLSLSFLFCLPLTIFSQSLTEIKGVTKNHTRPQIYLDNVGTEKVIDSSKINEKGEFEFKAKITNPDFYKIRFDENRYIFLIPEAGEKININIDLNNTYSAQITGSPNTELLYKTLREVQQYDKKLEDMKKQIANEKATFVQNFLTKNPGSLAALFFIDQLEMQKNTELVKMVAAELSKKYPQNFFVSDLNSKVNSTNKITEGAEAPEINLPDPTGKNIALSSLRGKIVLIDFWAAWCGPCRMESPTMVKIYEKYNKKGFEIYSVSIDREKQAWLKAIQDDKLNWTHVSDLKFWNSVVVKMYGFEGIPFTVLIDAQGKIIAKGLRGEQLAVKLQEIFKE